MDPWNVRTNYDLGGLSGWDQSITPAQISQQKGINTLSELSDKVRLLPQNLGATGLITKPSGCQRDLFTVAG